jgi:hypothetical protein
MNKKLMLILVLFISLFSIIIIAVWGTLPESQNQAQVTSITFNDYELNENDDKVINVLGIVTQDSPYYSLTYSFLPDNANAIISASSSSNGVKVIVNEIKQEVLVNFSESSTIGQNVTIRITDQKTNKYDEITFIFKIPDIIVGD